MSGGGGRAPFASAYGQRFRYRFSVGSPTFRVDLAGGRVWNDFWFGDKNLATSQGAQAVTAGVSLSGVGSTGSTGQGAQAVAGSGTVALPSQLAESAHGHGRAPFASAYGQRFRYRFSVGSPTFRVDLAGGRVWNDFWFGDKHVTTSQGGLLTSGTGAPSGEAGLLIIGQGGQGISGDAASSGAASGAILHQGGQTIAANASSTLITGLLVIGGSRVYSTNQQSLRIYVDGTESWGVDTGGTIYAVAVDVANNVYCAGERVSNITTRKYNHAGTLQWSKDHGATVHALVVDRSGNVITGGQRVNNVTVRKYNGAGTEQWTADHGGTVYGLAVGDNDAVFAGGDRVGSVTTRCYNSSGVEQFTVDHGGIIYAVHVAADGYFYEIGTRFTTGSARQYNSSGVLQKSYNPTVDDMYTGITDTDNHFFEAGNDFNTYTLYQYSSAGSGANHLYSRAVGSTLFGLALDTYQNIFACGAVNSNASVWKYSNGGTLQWSANHGDTTYAVAWKPLVQVSAIPALALSGHSAIPTAMAFLVMPALALPMDMAIPILPSFLPPASPSYSAQQIYRLYLTGTSIPLELPLAGMQCTRRYGESTWLNCLIPCWTAALENVIASRINTGEIIIYAGYSLSGVETLGLFLRATLIEYESERSSQYGTLSITGRVIPAPYVNTTKTLIGVSKVVDDDGRLQITSRPDFLLRPHDTVTVLGETLIVGTINYRIDSTDAIMVITELLGN